MMVMMCGEEEELYAGHHVKCWSSSLGRASSWEMWQQLPACWVEIAIFLCD
jgi:hypothetical protein